MFDVAELVAVLQEENARDICAIRVPRELRYVDYIVIGTGKSTRHLSAMAAYIRWAVITQFRSVRIHGLIIIGLSLLNV